MNPIDACNLCGERVWKTLKTCIACPQPINDFKPFYCDKCFVEHFSTHLVAAQENEALG